MKNPFFRLYVLASVMSLSQAVSYYYYTDGSPTINSNTCPISLCTQCATGRYNEGCGMDANHLNPQNCQDCVGLPANAYWLPWGAFPDGIASNSSICRSACNLKYRYDEIGNCVLGNCTVTISNAELTPGAEYPDCSTRCKAGYVGTRSINPTDCSTCLAGSFAQAGATTCTLCPKGTYLDIPNGKDLGDCKSAPAGTYTASDGSSIAQKCPSGTFSSAVGATNISTCQTCPAGHFCPEGSATATACPAGTSASGTGGTSIAVCVSCRPGTYMGSTGASACTECAAGTFSIIQGATNSSVCNVCPAGGYCASGSSSVTLCPSGTYSATTGQGTSATCLACATFFYNLIPGSTACLPCQFCASGEYKNNCGGSSEGTCFKCTNIPP